MKAAPDTTAEGVAVIGMACRFPGARDPETYWQNLRDGVESITFYGDRELEAAGVAREVLERSDYVKAAGVLADPFLFDASFFGIPPRQAEMLDPQHRVILECAWEALESAGYDPGTYPGAIGVFAGCGPATYLESRMSLEQKLELLDGPLALIEGGSLTTRLSFRLDLRGPSISLQTACSTSLVAVHLACQNLLDFQCDMALAGGVSIFFPQPRGYVYREGLSLSPDGRCRPFDRRAVGTVHGNGAGMVLLKRLADAVADGDPVRAVIRGSAVNNDGAAKPGFTAPCVEGLAEVAAMALGVADVPAQTIAYVETHGVGTPLGDSIEVAALTRAFRLSTDARGFCALGSNKPNVGHLDEASGVASLIKATLALEHRQIPPVLHFESPHPDLPLEGSPFFVNAKLSDWPVGDAPRRAAVSALGIGGTNAHVILEEAPPQPAETATDPWNLLVLSARDEAALAETTRRLQRHLTLHPDVNPSSLAYTLQGRRAFGRRRAGVYRDIADLRGLLADAGRLLDGEVGAAGPTTSRAAGPAGVDGAALPGSAGRADDLRGTLDSLGRLWVTGATVDLAGCHAGRGRRRLTLPTYPFQREHFEIRPTPAAGPQVEGTPGAAFVVRRPPRPPLPTPYAPPRNELEAEIVAAWQEVFGFASLGIHDDFMDLSGDSLLATQIASRLSRKLYLSLGPHQLFEHPSPAALAAHLAAIRTPDADSDRVDRLAELVGRLSAEEVKALLEQHRTEATDAPAASRVGKP